MRAVAPDMKSGDLIRVFAYDNDDETVIYIPIINGGFIDDWNRCLVERVIGLFGRQLTIPNSYHLPNSFADLTNT